MLRTSSVTLPAAHAPSFPDACVGCGEASPGLLLAQSDRSFSWASLWTPFGWFAGKKASRAAPICAACRRSDRFTSGARVLFVVGGVALAIVSLMPWLKSAGLSRGQRKLALLGLLLPAGLAFYLWTRWFPRAFTIDVSKSSVEYMFARREYAERFAAANDGRVE